MNKQLIQQYINKLKKEDIIIFSQKQGINLTNNELDLIFYKIKDNPEKILNNPLKEINSIKDNISINVYNKLIELYDKYKFFLNKIK